MQGHASCKYLALKSNTFDKESPVKQLIVLGLVGLFAAVGVARAQQPVAAQRSPSLQPAKQYRVVDLKSGSAVIDQPGNYVLTRSWTFKDLPDMPLNIIDVVADNVVLDFRGFAIDVEGMPDTAFITVIKVQGRLFTLKNAEITICCGAQASALRSTGVGTEIQGFRGYSFDTMSLAGRASVIRDSTFHARFGVGVSSFGRIENTAISCKTGCLGLGDDNKVLNSRLLPGESEGLLIAGDRNVVAGNLLDFPNQGPELEIGIDVRGNGNVVRDNTLAIGGETFVAMNVSGTGNVIDGNIGAVVDTQGSILRGIRFEQNGNFYGDNRMQTAVPFDLGGTTQTDWGDNVGY